MMQDWREDKFSNLFYFFSSSIFRYFQTRTRTAAAAACFLHPHLSSLCLLFHSTAATSTRVEKKALFSSSTSSTGNSYSHPSLLSLSLIHPLQQH